MTKFRVEVISQTPNPQQTIYAAMHQDYAEEFVWDDRASWPNEEKAGELIVRNLLKGGRGHFGPLEHSQIVLNCGWFPHSTMQQVRTHRVGLSFDVQSGRYTGQRIIAAVDKYFELLADPAISEYDALDQSVGNVFYLRPVGTYTARQGNKYEYTQAHRCSDLRVCLEACHRYETRGYQGFSEEHARGLIPFDVRQHWVMSANVRSLMHLLDLRWKADAQLEAQQLCEEIWPHFEAWVPEIAEWYKVNRLHKARLSP
jgi:thymidylate synthase (FAD)